MTGKKVKDRRTNRSREIASSKTHRNDGRLVSWYAGGLVKRNHEQEESSDTGLKVYWQDENNSQNAIWLYWMLQLSYEKKPFRCGMNYAFSKV